MVLTLNPPSRLSLVLMNKPVNPHARLVRRERLIDVDTCSTPTKVDAFAFLLDLTNAIFSSTHVGACLASTKCHDAIVLLLDLDDVVSITHVILLFMCLMPANLGLSSASWSLSPSLLACPSPLPVHRARTSHLIFSIAAAMIFLPHPKERDPMESKSA